MSDFLMKPKIDFAFKEIMMDEKARTGFLSAMLKMDPADIRETKISAGSIFSMAEDGSGRYQGDEDIEHQSEEAS